MKKMCFDEITPRTIQVLAKALLELPSSQTAGVQSLRTLASLIRKHSDIVIDSDAILTKGEPIDEESESASPVIVFILGGPGSGKGTVCSRLVTELGFAHLSVGDLLRAEVASGSSIGQEVDEIMRSGGLVSDELALSIVKDSIAKISVIAGGGSSSRLLLDGFPRTLEQAILFESNVGKVSTIVWLTCSDEVLVQRILARGVTSGRQDDNIESVTLRLKAFNENTERIREHYGSLKDGRLNIIDASLTSDEVFEQVSKLLA
jgi:adenylate kinase